MNRIVASICLYIFSVFYCDQAHGQSFIHPGIDQRAEDLSLMKKKVLSNEEPYISAFKRLKAVTDTPFVPTPHTHVLRGPYGKPNIGGDDLARSASMAYNNALVWYITNDTIYASRAKQILDAWSPVLWDFDYNDAKLLAAWTGHQLCNAAEILKHTSSGWSQKSIESFSNMLLTVYYPLFRFYFPQANGNWDGAIIHSILAIAVFTDNRKMFNDAVDHFQYGTVNGSLLKYVYPNGQCQESTRDQAHVQLGLGEFAGAAQIAYSQGVDLLSVADNRLALGFEYTASFLMGKVPASYGPISTRAMTLRDDFEYVYRHYAARGFNMPFTKAVADSVRGRATRSVLSAVRSSYGNITDTITRRIPAARLYVGAGSVTSLPDEKNTVRLKPGDDIQKALNKHAGTGRWIHLREGIHTTPATLKIPSGTMLRGEGIRSVIFLDPTAEGMREAIVNASDDMHDVIIRDLKIEGSNRTELHSDPNSARSYRGNYNRAGIMFRGQTEKQMKNISLLNLSLLNCTFNGVLISGAENVTVENCDLSENGGNTVPGPQLQHNLLLTHCEKISVVSNRLSTSPYGSGIALANCKHAEISNNEISRNATFGVQISESESISVTDNLIEANDKHGISVEFLSRGSKAITVRSNTIQYNGGYGLEALSVTGMRSDGNNYIKNREGEAKVKSNQISVMDN